MSNYIRNTKHPITGKFEMAEWLDDYYGKYRYGVRFPSGGGVYIADNEKWEFDDKEPKNPAESEVSEELLSESITSIPPQPAPEPKVSNSVGLDSPDELEEIFKKYANTTMPWEKEQLFTQPMRAEIEAYYAARFERALGANEPTLGVSYLEERNKRSARNSIRAEVRTRWEKGDGK